MLYTVQTPIRGSQRAYELCLEKLEAQTYKDFEWVICNDVHEVEPIQPVKTSFPQRIMRLGPRPPGWAYSIVRNVCIDAATSTAEYMVYLDVDWHLRRRVLEKCRSLLNPHCSLHGYKYYWRENGSLSKTKQFMELQIVPFDVVRASGGFDEIYFPWYGSSYDDLWRRMNLVRRLNMTWTKALEADSVATEIKFERDVKNNKRLNKRLDRLGTKQPIRRNTVPAKLVWEHGYGREK